MVAGLGVGGLRGGRGDAPLSVCRVGRRGTLMGARGRGPARRTGRRGGGAGAAPPRRGRAGGLRPPEPRLRLALGRAAFTRRGGGGGGARPGGGMGQGQGPYGTGPPDRPTGNPGNGCAGAGACAAPPCAARKQSQDASAAPCNGGAACRPHPPCPPPDPCLWTRPGRQHVGAGAPERLPLGFCPSATPCFQRSAPCSSSRGCERVPWGPPGATPLAPSPVQPPCACAQALWCPMPQPPGAGARQAGTGGGVPAMEHRRGQRPSAPRAHPMGWRCARKPACLCAAPGPRRRAPHKVAPPPRPAHTQRRISTSTAQPTHP
jgi:hypothetical protein